MVILTIFSGVYLVVAITLGLLALYVKYQVSDTVDPITYSDCFWLGISWPLFVFAEVYKKITGKDLI